MRMKSETMKMANGGTVDKIKKKIKDNLKKLAPKKTGPAGFTKKSRDMLKERLKQKDKNKIKDLVKKKVKQKSKGKSTKGGILSKAGIAPVSAPGGIPVVQSQKTAQKDPPKKQTDKRRPQDLPGFGKPRPPRRPGPGGPRPAPMPRRVTPLRPVSDNLKKLLDDLKKAKPMKDGGAMALVRKLKSSGKISTTDIERARAALQKAFKGQKPVLDSKGKPVKNLTQKADKVKLTPEQLKKIKGLQDKFLGKMPKRRKPSMKSLMGVAGKGMMKGAAGKSMKRKLKRLI